MIMSGLCKMKMSYFREDEKRFSLGYKRFQGGQNERGRNTHEPDRDTTIAHYSPCSGETVEPEESLVDSGTS